MCKIIYQKQEVRYLFKNKHAKKEDLWISQAQAQAQGRKKLAGKQGLFLYL